MFPSCREVVTFNHFLEEAAEKEVRGKARLQHFIENLLQRVDVAERQLEYYQNQQMVCNHTDVSEHVVRQQSLSPSCHPAPGAKVVLVYDLEFGYGWAPWLTLIAAAGRCAFGKCLFNCVLFVF